MPPAEFPIGDLQRQAGVHVVDVRDAEHSPGQLGQQCAFLVCVKQVVATHAQSPKEADEQEQVEPDLQLRRTGADRAREMRTA